MHHFLWNRYLFSLFPNPPVAHIQYNPLFLSGNLRRRIIGAEMTTFFGARQYPFRKITAVNALCFSKKSQIIAMEQLRNVIFRDFAPHIGT
jgi:hypothetical protein